MPRIFTVVISFFLFFTSFAQFTGKSGVYFLGSADIAVSASNYSNPDISGVVCRFRWETLEPSAGNFNWAFIDGEILKAKNANKKISLQPLGYPSWIVDSLNAQAYYYIDENQNHSTFGQVVSGVIPWDSIYTRCVKSFMFQLANKYAGDTTVSYLNLIGGQISRNLPDTVITDTTLLTHQPFWTAFNYNADTLAVLMDTLIDYYMTLFPSTPLWCSVDYVRFEMNASSRPVNYLATLYTNYGISNYPDRFGLFREDISGCVPYNTIASGSHWFILKNNLCRTGAQMLWSVQDGPSRMNKCGIVPNTKQVVLDSAISKGVAFGMRYIEIYSGDIMDTSLAATIAIANTTLNAVGNQCNGTMEIADFTDKNPSLNYFPNPAQHLFTVEFQDNIFNLEICTASGRKIYSQTNINAKIEINCKNFPNGIYFLRASGKNIIFNRKLVISR